MPPNPLISKALALHQKGQLQQAGDLYGQVLRQEPQNFMALHLLGVVRGQQGRPAEGI